MVEVESVQGHAGGGVINIEEALSHIPFGMESKKTGVPEGPLFYECHIFGLYLG